MAPISSKSATNADAAFSKIEKQSQVPLFTSSSSSILKQQQQLLLRVAKYPPKSRFTTQALSRNPAARHRRHFTRRSHHGDSWETLGLNPSSSMVFTCKFSHNSRKPFFLLQHQLALSHSSPLLFAGIAKNHFSFGAAAIAVAVSAHI